MITQYTTKPGKAKEYVLILFLFMALAAGAVLCWRAFASMQADLRSRLAQSAKIERKFIESLPIYQDFADPEKEKKLRTYLLESHIQAAARHGMTPIGNVEEVRELSRAGKLVKLETGREKQYYFYNVRDAGRYLTPTATRGLAVLTQRFQENCRKKGPQPYVKIALSSVLRTMDYQQDLQKSNPLATVRTSHAYGTSFDIFYDEFFVVLPEPSSPLIGSDETEKEYARRMGFLLGGALRRQFHAVLMETLIQMQDEGLLYAILEQKQRCYHVTILPR